MWEIEYSKFYKDLKKEDVWRVWADVNNWSKWRNDLEYCRMKDDFVVGNHFTLKPKKGPAVQIELVKITIGREFVDCTKFLGAKMYGTHLIKEEAGGILLTSKIAVKGPLRWLWIKLVAQKIAQHTPYKIDALVSFARNGR